MVIKWVSDPGATWYDALDTSKYPDWYRDQICNCKAFKYQSGWEESLTTFQVVPTCRNCGKWANRMMKCCRCREWFYHFFSHPAVGYHSKPRRGWYCWNCCIRYWPPTVEVRSKPREIIPPPRFVVPPGTEILEYDTTNPF